mmetsp:Transcript_14367/g.27539  ORF Transcript_14367/g.27539 Transcript_14367/m.27539 type:complete len:324 (+) Transcript_14367:1816-2787(+)
MRMWPWWESCRTEYTASSVRCTRPSRRVHHELASMWWRMGSSTRRAVAASLGRRATSDNTISTCACSECSWVTWQMLETPRVALPLAAPAAAATAWDASSKATSSRASAESALFLSGFPSASSHVWSRLVSTAQMMESRCSERKPVRAIHRTYSRRLASTCAWAWMDLGDWACWRTAKSWSGTTNLSSWFMYVPSDSCLQKLVSNTTPNIWNSSAPCCRSRSVSRKMCSAKREMFWEHVVVSSRKAATAMCTYPARSAVCAISLTARRSRRRAILGMRCGFFSAYSIRVPIFLNVFLEGACVTGSTSSGSCLSLGKIADVRLL